MANKRKTQHDRIPVPTELVALLREEKKRTGVPIVILVRRALEAGMRELGITT